MVKVDSNPDGSSVSRRHSKRQVEMNGELYEHMERTYSPYSASGIELKEGEVHNQEFNLLG